MRDFTPLQALQWVEQELAKCTTEDRVRDRIASEEKFRDMMDDRYPNSRKAHAILVDRLYLRLKELT